MKKRIAFSDLHGQYNLWTAIKNYYNKDDILIFLGDACDRGPDGIKIMQELLADPRVIYIRGNHEDMFLNFVDKGLDNLNISDEELAKYNGCTPTLEAFRNLEEQEQKSLVSQLKRKLQFSYIYINKEKKNIFLSHAGIDFSEIGTDDFNKLIWNRYATIEKPWDNKYKYWYIIHGHTPTPTLIPNSNIPKILRYENNHKIDIDLASFVTHTIAAIDLDTLQVKYFKDLLGI